MKGLISHRINKQHRLVYEVFDDEKLIKVYRMWTHYE
jgi:toxin YoeB